MPIKTIPHVTFAQLPFAAKALFYIESLSVFEYHNTGHHTSMEVFTDLEKIWNTEQLTLEGLKDWSRMSELLQEKLPKLNSQRRRSIKLETMHQGRRQK